MKYLKTFESMFDSLIVKELSDIISELSESLANHDWKNIVKKDKRLYVNLYGLAKEMEKFGQLKGHEEVEKMEFYYVDFVIKLLEGKVITLDTIDINHTGICEYVELDGGHLPVEENKFELQYIQIKFEDMDEYWNVENNDIIVHLDIDTEMFRNAQKYNT